MEECRRSAVRLSAATTAGVCIPIFHALRKDFFADRPPQTGTRNVVPNPERWTFLTVCECCGTLSFPRCSRPLLLRENRYWRRLYFPFLNSQPYRCVLTACTQATAMTGVARRV